MTGSNASSPRRLVQIVCGLAAAVIAIFLVQTFKAPPQIGTDDEAFATVDALFTALTSRDEARLNDCEERLLELREANQLPPKAADQLDSMLQQARSGQWEPAAKRLYEFMYRQRREDP
jgi:hypothetical protein